MSKHSICRVIRGVEVDIHGRGYEYSPDIGIFGMFEEIWATDLDGRPFELTDEEFESLGVDLAEAYENQREDFD